MEKEHATVTAIAMIQADLATYRALLLAGFTSLGLQEIDGVPLIQWVEMQRIKELEKLLLDIGDSSPALHDTIQACIAEAIKNARPH